MQFTNLGAGCHSACIGGDFTLTPRTIWLDRNPIIGDWENPPQIKMDEQSKVYTQNAKKSPARGGANN